MSTPGGKLFLEELILYHFWLVLLLAMMSKRRKRKIALRKRVASVDMVFTTPIALVKQ